MRIFKNLKTYFSSRWGILTDRNIEGERRIFAGMELFCFPASFLTLLVLLPAHIVMIRCGISLPGWTTSLLNVLLSAAVGYITNYIAIEMLFKPYERNFWHPLSLITFGYWKQGLIPKNKNRIGIEMGQQIETKLLNPEQLADELCVMVMGFIQSRSVIADLRNAIQSLLHSHEKTIVDFLVPQIEKAVATAADTMLTPEKVTVFWKSEIEPFLLKEENRKLISSHIVAGLQRRAPELTEMIKTELQKICQDYLSRKLPFGIGAETISAGLVACIEWNDIQLRLQNKLGEESVSAMLQDELQILVRQMNDWLKSPETMEKINVFIAEMKNKLKTWLHEYLQTALPAMTDEIIDSEKLWAWIENDLLPAAKPKIEALIREQGKDKIIEKLNLSRRISEAVEKQKVEDFHEMINSIAAQHLGAIQVLGYILGLIVGLTQLLIK